MSTMVLLDELHKAGIYTVGLNQYLLKSLIFQRLEIHKLWKSLTNGEYARRLSRGQYVLGEEEG